MSTSWQVQLELSKTKPQSCFSLSLGAVVSIHEPEWETVSDTIMDALRTSMDELSDEGITFETRPELFLERVGFKVTAKHHMLHAELQRANATSHDCHGVATQ